MRRLLALWLVFVSTGALAWGQTSKPLALHISGILVEDIAPVFYAQSSGIFRKNGLDVTFDQAASGGAVVSAVVSGAYPIGKASVISSFRAVSHDIPLVAIAPGWVFDSRVPSAEFIVAADSAYRTGGDLNGKTVAVSSLNELNQLAAKMWIDKHGGDAKSVHFIELPLNASAAALEAHRIDATVLLEPALSAALAGAKVRSLGSAFAAIAPTFPVSVWIASRAWAEAHPDQTRAFARSLREASEYLNHHPDEVVSILANATGTSPDALRQIRRVTDGTSLTTAMLRPLADAASRYVDMPPVSLNDFIFK